MINLLDLWEKSVAQYPACTALVGSDERATYAEVESYINDSAEILGRILGVTSGVKVALFFTNEPNFVVAFFAVLKAGGIPCPLNANLTIPELDQLLMVVKPDAAIVGAISPQLKQHLQSKLPVGTLVQWQLTLPTSTIAITDMDPQLAGVACILCTSGTTGLPKAAMLTHENLTSNAYALWANKRWLEQEIFGNALPVFHVYGITVLTLLPLSMGGTVVFMPPFSPESCLRTIQAEGVTRFGGVPSMFSMLNKYRKWEQFSFPSCQSWISGGAPLPGAVVEEFTEKFSAFIYEGYGMLETSPGISWNLDDRPYHQSSVGRPLAGVEVKILDESGKSLPQGQSGEIWVKGLGVMKGYYQNPTATAETIHNGWLCTGDIGRFDAEGYLYLMGRKKELMIVGGHNVYPREIETVLLEDMTVADAAVAAKTDSVRGEQVLAFVVPVPGTQIDEQALIARCRQQLSSFKIPRKIHTVAHLPRNDSGKILRNQLLNLVSYP